MYPQNSGSQPGVRIPLGVREKLKGGTQNFNADACLATLLNITIIIIILIAIIM